MGLLWDAVGANCAREITLIHSTVWLEVGLFIGTESPQISMLLASKEIRGEGGNATYRRSVGLWMLHWSISRPLVTPGTMKIDKWEEGTNPDGSKRLLYTIQDRADKTTEISKSGRLRCVRE